jgi:hypothetical protein
MINQKSTIDIAEERSKAEALAIRQRKHRGMQK